MRRFFVEILDKIPRKINGLEASKNGGICEMILPVHNPHNMIWVHSYLRMGKLKSCTGSGW